MQVIEGIDQLRARVRAWRDEGAIIGLVPTMGNLHAGHLDLARRMREQADRVIVSIFVNPLQFGAGEDFDSYPRTIEQDCQQLRELGVDAVFAPSVAEVYPDGSELATRVTVSGIGDILCGASRPGHFSGVATVVAKLFNLVQPDRAIFGKKDYQQLMVIRRMVRDLNIPVTVVEGETVREADGLAMSSRNGYLSPSEREQAPRLAQVLSEAAERIHAGERDYPALEAHMAEALRADGFEPDYVTIRRQHDLAPADAACTQLVILAAAWLGRARLLDNIEVRLNARA